MPAVVGKCRRKAEDCKLLVIGALRTSCRTLPVIAGGALKRCRVKKRIRPSRGDARCPQAGRSGWSEHPEPGACGQRNERATGRLREQANAHVLKKVATVGIDEKRMICSFFRVMRKYVSVYVFFINKQTIFAKQKRRKKVKHF